VLVPRGVPVVLHPLQGALGALLPEHRGAAEHEIALRGARGLLGVHLQCTREEEGVQGLTFTQLNLASASLKARLNPTVGVQPRHSCHTFI